MNKGKRGASPCDCHREHCGAAFPFCDLRLRNAIWTGASCFSENERYVINGLGRTAKASWATEAPTVTSAFLLQ